MTAAPEAPGQAAPAWFEAGPAASGPGAMAPLQAYLGRLVEERFPASYRLCVVTGAATVVDAGGGFACAVGRTVPVTPGTIYDLASLTKVLCTVPLLMQACGRGRISLDDPVQGWLPRYPVAATTLRHLVTHTSGLVSHRPFFQRHQGRDGVEGAVYQEARGTAPGAEVVYSDLNFMLLGWVLEGWAGQPLDELFAVSVSRPLGLQATAFRPSPAARGLVAATELDGDQRLGPGLVWGEVHDGNAYALGGVAGHAGLFAPATDLGVIARAYLSSATGLVTSSATGLVTAAGPSTPAPTNAVGPSTPAPTNAVGPSTGPAPFPPGAVAELGRFQAGSGEDVRGVGWRLSPPPDWGEWPEGTIWHTGFTGTSVLMAPALGAAVILLANAVHPRRDLPRQADVRSRVHRLVREVLG